MTTYQALFNGRSRFRSDDISAVIFDDSHTADQILRDQFSLSITRSELTDTFDQILALFQPYHNAVGLAAVMRKSSAVSLPESSSFLHSKWRAILLNCDGCFSMPVLVNSQARCLLGSTSETVKDLCCL